MSSITTYCPICGSTLDPGNGSVCAHCSETRIQPQGQHRLWGARAGFLVWLASVILTFGIPLIFSAIYLIAVIARTGQTPSLKTLDQDPAFYRINIFATFPAHLLILAICWRVVTSRGSRPFLQTLGWEWHPRFKWFHAIVVAILMLGVALLCERFLPHHETDFERILKMSGYLGRLMIVVMAVATAPLVEEVVYRGVLYGGIEKSAGKLTAILIVTLLFALVHVPQYQESVASIVAILSLSLALTSLRAWTGKLLPCVATHLVYNAIQAVPLLLPLEKTLNNQPDQSALILIWRFFV